LAALLVAVVVPKVASATQSAELLRSQAHFYGRFEARVRFAPGEGVVSSFFLWKDGSSSTTSWNELDFEKINSDCRLQTNIWTGKGTQSATINTPSFNICSDYHTYAFEWTPDYIAWLIDGTQIRKVTGASVTEYTQNASQGMTVHFNIWAGDSSFGGNLSASTLPVYQYVSWVQYSSYSNGTFQMQWREDFNASTAPSGWSTGNWTSPLNHSTHNPANVKFVNGIAVLAMTADNATGYSGTPPADGSSGAAGTTGTGGSGAGGSGGGSAGRGGTGGTGGGGRGGTAGSAAAGTGGMTSTGKGGTGGGTPAGAAGNGAGGVSSGAAGSGAGGTSVGVAGNGAGGDPVGTAGTTGTTSGSAGVSGAAGDAVTGEGGVPATGGSTGAGGSPTGGGETPTGSDTGCGCRTAADGSTDGKALLALLLFATVALRRRSSIRS
jgi:MYXO-CTERM domain-containing protein